MKSVMSPGCLETFVESRFESSDRSGTRYCVGTVWRDLKGPYCAVSVTGCDDLRTVKLEKY